MFQMDWVQSFLFVLVLFALTPLLGLYIAKLITGGHNFLSPLLGWLERFSCKAAGCHPAEEMTWDGYAKSLICFNLVGFLALFFLLLFQQHLPWNPENLPAPSLPLAFNIAASFTTNTNWQSYAPETTLSYFVQMAGLTVQNFLSAATGLAASFALIRGITRSMMATLGSFWVDLVRVVVYLFLPLCLLLAFALIAEGVIQNVSPYKKIETLEGVEQVIALGPAASQVAIKQIGTNGGGFFNANSAHPFENPSPLTNFLETLAVCAIPAALIYAYGVLAGSKIHGWILFFAMFVIWAAGFGISLWAQSYGNPALEAYPSMEGMEVRFGGVNSLLWTTLTTATANGSVNAMISSLSPLAGGIALLNILLGETVFGGVGVGLSAAIMFAVLTVFLCGLMVGRTPEYFGKKIEKNEIKWVIVSLLLPGILILVGSSLSLVNPQALQSLGNLGPHGLTEILYAFSSAAGNNGSAFAGLNANTDYFNISLGVVMIMGRLAIIIPSLALAGLFVVKKTAPSSLGTFSTQSFLFFILLICVILIVGALTFFPALILGPIVEHILMLEGQSF